MYVSHICPWCSPDSDIPFLGIINNANNRNNDDNSNTGNSNVLGTFPTRTFHSGALLHE